VKIEKNLYRVFDRTGAIYVSTSKKDARSYVASEKERDKHTSQEWGPYQIVKYERVAA
jgi:hypothetical protein